MKPVKAWHFSKDRKLAFGDGREIRKGRTHKIKGIPELCSHGLHGSIRAIDALGYAPGNIVSRVIIGGDIVRSYDKLVGTERTYIWVADASHVLDEFARWCALQVIDLWDAPDIVIQFLRTGDESLRAAARDAARDAAATWEARAAAYAARAAARDAAWDAARVAWAAAAGAALDADRYDFMHKANRKLTRMLNSLEKDLKATSKE